MRDFFTLSQSTSPSLWMSRMRCALICSGCHQLSSFLGCAQAPSNGFPSSFVPFYFLSFLMLIYSFIADYQAINLRYKDNTARNKNETKVGKQSANLGKNNEPIQNRISFLIDCKSVILHHLTILLFPMVRPAWDNWWLLANFSFFILFLSGCLGENDYIRCRNTYRKGGK